MIDPQTLADLDRIAAVDSAFQIAATRLRRLVLIDEQLRTSGLAITEFAEQHGCTDKTVKRDLQVIRKLIGPTRFEHGAPYRQFYESQK